MDDGILARLAKRHTRADFVEALGLVRKEGLALAPTFVAFTPWTTREGYCELLRAIRDLGLIESVPPVQLALRLLIPPQSRLLELEEVRRVVTRFDEAALLHRWRHPDGAMDELARGVLGIVTRMQKEGASRGRIFGAVWREAHEEAAWEDFDLLPRAAVPYLDEPWYC